MKTFEELGVSPEILKAIKEMGYENPMPVQEEVIPYLLGNGTNRDWKNSRIWSAAYPKS